MNAPSLETVVLSPVTDDEREDGEIVDDDLEDISDYSIPSSGKSEYSERLIRAISLSSLSGSDGERAYCDRKLLLTALAADGVSRSSRRHKKVRRKSGSRTKTHTGSRKRHRDGRETLSPAQPRARKRRRKASYSRSASLSSNSTSDIERHVIDTRTLRRLNKAVRIETNATEEISHKSLKDRLQRMIHPLTPEVIESSDFNISLVDVDSKISNADNLRSLDDTHDKELEELRSQALKSAMLKKHMERKKRREALNKRSSDLLQVNDKENESSNAMLTETRTIERMIDGAEHDLPEKTNEDDLDIMRAMLLASMSTKITTEQPSKSPNATSPPQNTLLAISTVAKSSSSSPIPLEFLDKKKPTSNFSVPPVKPLIIRANYDSESDTDLEFEDDNKRTSQIINKSSVVNKIETSVDEFLRKQREQFEAKLVEDKVKDSLLNKSFLKLLPQSQQEEYNLLQQKLLEAKKIKTKSKTNQLIASTTTTSKDIPTTVEEKTKKDKKDRLHPKGKYRELVPLVRKINAEVAAQRREEQNMRRLMEELKAARHQVAVHQKRHMDLVGQLKKTRALIDLRWQKLAKTKTLQLKRLELEQESKEKQIVELVLSNSMKLKHFDSSVTVTTAVQNNNVAKSNELNDVAKSIQIGDEDSAIEDKSTNVNKVVSQQQILPNGTYETRRTSHVEESVPTNEVADAPEPLSYVSPLDKRETSSQSNPLQMLCPYELFGVCKDPTCTFNHCP